MVSCPRTGSSVKTADILLSALVLGTPESSSARIISAVALELRSRAAAVTGARPAEVRQSIINRVPRAERPSGGTVADSLRNRLFLKYWGIDYEFYLRDTRYGRVATF